MRYHPRPYGDRRWSQILPDHRRQDLPGLIDHLSRVDPLSLVKAPNHNGAAFIVGYVEFANLWWLVLLRLYARELGRSTHLFL